MRNLQHLGISRFKNQLRRDFKGVSLTLVLLLHLTLFFLHVSFSKYIKLFSNMQTLCRWIHSEEIDGLSPKRNINVVAAGIIEILMILQSSAGGSYLLIFRGSNPIMWRSCYMIVYCKSVFKFQHSRCNWKLIQQPKCGSH